jgi:hypothetical protein
MAVDEVLAGYLETGVVDDAAVAALDPDARAEVLAVLAHLDHLRAVLADGDSWADPDPELEARVIAAVTGAGSAAVAPRSLADARLRRSRFVAIGASLVAAAAIVVAVIGFTTRPAPAPAPAAGDEFALVGTDLLQGASGSVHVKETGSGVRIYLDATGLPRRENGQFYEAWAKTKHGMVSIGTFHTGTDVVLWSGVSIPDIEAITVTLEDDDGNPASSGQRVLIAQLH